MKLHLPYLTAKTNVTVRNEPVQIKAFQVIVWVSIATMEFDEWDSGIPRFPAILDSGHSHNFALTEAHLQTWAGIQSARLPRLGSMRKEGERAPLFKAKLWLHTDDEPYALKIDEGIAVFAGAWPRLPILGLRALTNSKLQTFIYGDTKRLLIRTPPKWYWPF